MSTKIRGDQLDSITVDAGSLGGEDPSFYQDASNINAGTLDATHLPDVGTPVSASFVKITTDAHGRVSATTAPNSSDIITALAYTPVNRAGDTMTGFLVLNADPVSASQATTKNYVDTTTVSLAGDTMTGALVMSGAQINMGSNKIISLLDPTSAQDAATKAYVDAVASGLDLKASCRAATTANITLSGTQTIDGVSVIVGDRVLVKNQSTGANNGIYVVASGAWTRATDFDNSPSGEVTTGAFTFVEEGTTLTNTGWVLITANPITIGVTSLTFSQFSGVGILIAGSNTQIQYNNSGTFGASSDFTWNNSTKTLFLGTNPTITTGAGSALSIGAQPALNTTANGSNVNITGGTAGSSSGQGGDVVITGGAPINDVGGDVALSGSAGVGLNKNGGDVQLFGGAGSGIALGGLIQLFGGAGGTGGSGGHISMVGGSSNGATGQGGSIIQIAGTSSGGGVDGYYAVSTGTPTTERLRILGNGAWSVGPNGTDTGTAGFALVSNGGTTAPSWQLATTAPAGSDTQLQYNNAGSFGGASSVTFSSSTNTLTFQNYVSTGGYAAQGSTTNAALTNGFTVTIANNITHYIASGSGTLASGTFTMPSAPAQNQVVTIATRQTITSLTVQANSGQTIQTNVSTLSAGSGVSFIYSGTIWIQMSSTATGSSLIAGSNTQVQFNDGGTFGADADFTWDKTTNIMTLGSSSTPATIIGASSTSGSSVVTVQAGPSTGAAIKGGQLSLLGGDPANGDGGDVLVSGRLGVGTNRAGGAVNLTGGAATGSATAGAISLTGGTNSNTSGVGGTVTLTGGVANAATGTAGNVSLVGGTSSSGTAGYLVFTTTSTERLRILANGAWSVGTGGAATGTSGQALISQGPSSAPIWGTPTTATTATNVAGGAVNNILFQSGGSTTSVDTDFLWFASTNILSLGSVGTPATIIAPDSGASPSAGPPLTITAGHGGTGASSLSGGALTLAGGNSVTATGSGNGGAISISGGNVTNSANTGAGGNVTITGGTSSNTTSGNGGNATFRAGDAAIGGSLTLRAGDSTQNLGGSVTIRGGTAGGGGAGGSVTISASSPTVSTGAGGAVVINAGNGGSSSGNRGTLSLWGGATISSGNGFPVNNLMVSGALANGDTLLSGAIVTAANLTGGRMIIAGGFGGTTVSGNGGDVFIQAGAASTAASGTASGGNLNMYGGLAGNGGSAGIISLYTGGNNSTSTGPTERLRINATGQTLVSDGLVGTPGLSFISDPDNGAYRIGTNNWALSAGGTKVIDMSTTVVTVPVIAQFTSTSSPNVAGTSGVTIATENSGGAIGWANASGATNSKYWDMYTDTTFQAWRVVNDAVNSATNYLVVTRSGLTVTSIQTTATEVYTAARDTSLYAATSTASASYTLDLSTGNTFKVTLNNTITTWAFSNAPVTGRAYTFTIFLAQDATGSRTITWPASVHWTDGVTPTLTTTASKMDAVTMTTFDGGTTYYAGQVMANLTQ